MFINYNIMETWILYMSFSLLNWDFWRPVSFCIMIAIHNINLFYILKSYDAERNVWMEDT